MLAVDIEHNHYKDIGFHDTLIAKDVTFDDTLC